MFESASAPTKYEPSQRTCCSMTFFLCKSSGVNSLYVTADSPRLTGQAGFLHSFYTWIIVR